MHEFGLCDGIIEAVQHRAAGRRVARVCVRVGVLQRVVESALQQAFAHAAEGTEAEDAHVDLVTIPVTTACRLCNTVTETSDIILVCPSCGGASIEIISGDELILESLEYEAPVESRTSARD